MVLVFELPATPQESHSRRSGPIFGVQGRHQRRRWLDYRLASGRASHRPIARISSPTVAARAATNTLGTRECVPARPRHTSVDQGAQARIVSPALTEEAGGSPQADHGCRWPAEPQRRNAWLETKGYRPGLQVGIELGDVPVPGA